MEEVKKQVVYLEDGRRAEKVIATGDSKVVTEIWSEPKIDKKLTQRVVEHKKEIVHRREIETIDENTGDVVERKIESIEPNVKMELREHIQTNDSVSAQNVEDCHCYVTQEEMQKTFTDGFMAVASVLGGKCGPDCVCNSKVSAQSLIEEKLESKGLNVVEISLWATVAVVSALFVYVVFLL